MAPRWPLAGQEIGLVVTIEMHFVGHAAEILSGLQLVDDVGIAGSRHEGREPVKPGEDAVLDFASRHLARPADDRRHAEATLIDRALSGAEWGHAAVRPGEPLGAVVGGEDDD